MFEQKKTQLMGMALVMLLVAGMAMADVFDMPEGQTNLEFVKVGNLGNLQDSTGYGAVDYTYSIGKYEVTAGQYCEFLNAVAGSDPHLLYNPQMWVDSAGCKIQRHGSDGFYSYTISPDRANRPVNYVSWGDAMRFTNWLSNGQPTGAQDLSTTEAGSYSVNGAMDNDYAAMSAIRREADCTYVVNSEDEWYKAAFHKNDGDTDNYWLYQTACDTVPSNLLVNPDPGNNATFAGCNTAPYYHTEVGEHENSASSYGTFDQGGNVFEWIETNSGSLAIRGGSYYYGTNWFGERYTTTTGEFGDRGFRVALIPEPATLSLLGIGGLAVLRRRHH